MWTNLRVSFKLAAGFGAVILLAIALGSASFWQVRTIGGVWDGFETVTLKKRDAATKGLQGLQDGIHYFKNFVLRGGDYANKFGGAMTNIDRAVSDYRKAGEVNADEDKLLLQIAEGVNGYRKAIEEAQRLAAERQTSNQIDLAIKGADKVLNDGFVGLLEINAKRTREAASGIRAVVATASQWIVVLSVAILALGVLASWLIGRAITRPLAVAVNAANAIAAGDLTVKIEADSKDETGQLKASMQRMTAAIQALVTDAKLLSVAAVEGKLATRADASKHQGDFQKIVAGVNQTLDAVIGPLNVAAGYVDRISKGDIPAKITDNYNGDFNILKNNLNTCIDAVNALIADARMLSSAAVEGRLGTRADVARHQGDFRKIIEGVNQTLDAVIGPLNVAAGYVDRIAKGDIPPKISDAYNGDFNILKNNLNTCIDAVNALVVDANMLSQAAVDGKLETRAD
ncbi:MAG: HAMP domain-containing protein, partial [Sterolibacterium sp.]